MDRYQCRKDSRLCGLTDFHNSIILRVDILFTFFLSYEESPSVWRSGSDVRLHESCQLNYGRFSGSLGGSVLQNKLKITLLLFGGVKYYNYIRVLLINTYTDDKHRYQLKQDRGKK